RVPASAPRIEWRVTGTDPRARGGTAIMKQVAGDFGAPADGFRINLTVYTPAAARRPVPMILIVNFGGGRPATRGGPSGPVPTGDPPVAAEIIDRGWGFATIRYQDIQADRANAWKDGVIGLALREGQSEPANDEWGTISAWAWGI